jgi:hypothetical protein
MVVYVEVEEGKYLPDCDSTEFKTVRGGWKEWRDSLKFSVLC